MLVLSFSRLEFNVWLPGIRHAECWFSNISGKLSVATFRVNHFYGVWQLLNGFRTRQCIEGDSVIGC
jgi:hypothetical protein